MQPGKEVSGWVGSPRAFCSGPSQRPSLDSQARSSGSLSPSPLPVGHFPPPAVRGKPLQSQGISEKHPHSHSLAEWTSFSFFNFPDQGLNPGAVGCVNHWTSGEFPRFLIGWKSWALRGASIPCSSCPLGAWWARGAGVGGLWSWPLSHHGGPLLCAFLSPFLSCETLQNFGFTLGSFSSFCAPVSSRLFHLKLGEPEGEAWMSVLGWLVKGNLALPRDPPCVRPPRGSCPALRAFIASWRVPFLSRRGSCFISERSWQFPPP